MFLFNIRNLSTSQVKHVYNGLVVIPETLQQAKCSMYTMVWL